MRGIAFLVMLLLAVGAAAGQNDTAGNDGAAGDAPTANDTPSEGGAGDGAANGTEEPAEEQPTGPVALTLVGHADGGFYWTSPDHPGRNPRIQLPPNTEVVITAQQAPDETVPHNLKVGDGPTSEIFADPGSEIVYTFTTPASGNLLYICLIHGTPMSGTFVVGAAGGGGGGGAPAGDADEVINGPSVSLQQVAPNAPCDRPIPEVATRDVVGGPTVQDYVAGCVQTSDSEAPAAHPADLVLPISWLLIGLGVVGVVWVHKYYKP